MEPKYQKKHVFRVLKYVCPRKVYRAFPLKQLENQFPDLMDHRDVDAFSKAIYNFSGDLMFELMGHPDVFVLALEHNYHCAEMDDVEAMQLPATVFRVINDQGKRFMFAEDFENKLKIVGPKGDIPKHKSVDGFHRMIPHRIYGEYLAINVTLKFQEMRYDGLGLPFPIKSPKSTWCMPAWFAIRKLLFFLKHEMNSIPSLCHPDSAPKYLSAIKVLEDWFPHENAEVLFVDYEKLEEMFDQLEIILDPFTKNMKQQISLRELEEVLNDSLKRGNSGIVPLKTSFEEVMRAAQIDHYAYLVVGGLPNLRKYIIKTGIWGKIFGDRWTFDPKEATPVLPAMPHGKGTCIVSPVSLPKVDGNNNDDINKVEMTKSDKKSDEGNALSKGCSSCDSLKIKVENYRKSAINQDKAIEKMKKVQKTMKQTLEDNEKKCSEVEESKESKKTIRNLEKKVGKLTKDLDDKNDIIEAFQTENLILLRTSNRIPELSNVIKDMQLEREGFLKKIEEAKNLIKIVLKESKCRVDDVMKENDTLNRQLAELREVQNVAELENELETSMDEARRKSADVLKENDDLREESSEIKRYRNAQEQQKSRQSSNEAGKLNLDISGNCFRKSDESKQLIVNLESKNEQLMKTVDEQQKLIEGLYEKDSERKKANNDDTHTVEDYEKLAESYNELKRERDELMKKMAEKEKLMNSSLEDAGRSIAFIQKENDELKAESEKIKKGRNAQEQQKASKQSSDEAGKVNLKLEKKIEKLTNTINKNRKSMEKYHALEKNYQKIIESKKKMKTEFDEYKQTNVLLENRIEDFRKKLIEKGGILDEKRKENQQLQELNQMLIASLDENEVKTRELEKKYDELAMNIPMDLQSAKLKLKEMKEALNILNISEMKKKVRDGYEQFLESYPKLEEVEKATQELSDFEKDFALYEYVLKANIHKIETSQFVLPKDLLQLREVPGLIDFNKIRESSNLN